jgi:putative membrane protein
MPLWSGDRRPARLTGPPKLIVRPKTSWFRMLFAWQGTVQNTILLPLAIILGLSLLALWGQQQNPYFFLRLSPVPFSLIGVALAIFASFRNNACYERYWEGRKLWGVLTGTTRYVVRFAVTVPGLSRSHPQVHRVVDLLAAFIHTLKHQLRGTDPTEALTGLLGREQAFVVAGRAYRTQYLLTLLQDRFVSWRDEGRLSDVMLAAGLDQLDALAAAAGGCERIRSTPVPYAYEVLLHRTTYFYCALLPFGLVESTGWATPIVAVFISYAFLALHIIAGELEDPFGQDANDLPLDALSTHIERAMREAVGDQALAPVPAPDARYRLG